MTEPKYVVVVESHYQGKLPRLIRCIPATEFLPQVKECMELLGEVGVYELDEAGNVRMSEDESIGEGVPRHWPVVHGVHPRMIQDNEADACNAALGVINEVYAFWQTEYAKVGAVMEACMALNHAGVVSSVRPVTKAERDAACTGFLAKPFPEPT